MSFVINQEIELEYLTREIINQIDIDDIFDFIVELERQSENQELLRRLHTHFTSEILKVNKRVNKNE